jgi:hypothetical protein
MAIGLAPFMHVLDWVDADPGYRAQGPVWQRKSGLFGERSYA